MKKKREYKPAGIKARITLNYYLPGIVYTRDAQEIIARVLTMKGKKGDCVMMGDILQDYWVIEEDKAEKLGLPKRPEGFPAPEPTK